MTTIVDPETKPQADRNEAPVPAEPRIEIERPVVLAARGLQKAFGGQIVLDGVDLQLREGEVILLRGDNGCGKTTLINILTGNLEPDAGTIRYLADGSPREFCFPRRWWQELNPFDHFTPESTARKGIGRMWQDVRLFNSQTLRDNIAVAEPHHLGENPIRALFAPGRCRHQEAVIARKADDMLGRLGLAGREASCGDKISLGQSKRVAIARAVAAGARILFLDEPLAGLDRQGIRDVLALLESIARDHAVTLVIIEHVFSHAHLRGHISAEWLLEAGRIRRTELSHAYQPERTDQTQLSRPPWFSLLAPDGAEIRDERLPNGALLTRIKRDPAVGQSPKAALEIRGLAVKRGSRTVIGLDNDGNEAGLDLTVHEGEVALLQAPNGWGKSTLQAAVCGLVPIAAGSITLCGDVLHDLRTWERVRKGLVALPAERRSFPRLTGHEVSLLAGDSANELHREPFMGRVSSSMSGGEIQRLMLSSLDSLRHRHARLFVLDEPFAALDENAATEAARFIARQSSPVLILMPSASA